MERTYTKSDFQRLISESASEFKAKLGPNVAEQDKDINGKAYSDAKKRAKDYDGGLGKEQDWARGKAEYRKEDYNGTMLDLNPDNVSDDYKKRVHAQVKGYSSEKEMNNGIEKSGDFSGNEKIYKAIKDTGKKMDAEKEAEGKKGLVGRTRPEGYFKKQDMFENRNIKTVHFKKTEFMSESHMKSRIPDDFKTDGSVFRMKDKIGNEYIVEWNQGKATVLEHTNKTGGEQTLGRMKRLMEYKTRDTLTNTADRINENDDKFADTLNKMRQILK